MRKRILIIMIFVVVISLALFLILFSSPSGSNPLENIFNPSPEESNGTNTPRFPKITFPWSAKESGSGSAGSGSGGSGGGSGSGTSKPPVIKNNYTLSVDSGRLSVLVNYVSDGTIFNEINSRSFSLDIPEGSDVCLSETTNSNSIRWYFEDQTECPSTTCEGNLYSCRISMSGNYTIYLIQNS